MKPNIIEIRDDSSIIAAGPVKLSEGLRPTRVVLRSLPGQFVTHVEFMNIHVEERPALDAAYDAEKAYAYVVCTHEGFDNGHYFDYGINGVKQKDALEAARKDYNERLGR